MSFDIPFDIQEEVIKRFPVKSLLQFRSVSKQWNSLIDSPEFIKNYHINHPNPQHHLLVWYNRVPIYTSIIDDNTFPQQKFPLTAPEPLSLLTYGIIGSVDGLVCFLGWSKDIELDPDMVVLWNPSIRKSVGIPIPSVFDDPVDRYTRIGFGVCPHTNDPKLLKINVVKTPSICWDVQIFRLTSRVWKTAYKGAPFKSCDLTWNHVFIDGVIYWCSSGSFVISFDLKREKFDEVCLPERLAISTIKAVMKVNESLGVLQYHEVGRSWHCGVWMRKDGVNKPFTKIYDLNLKAVGKSVTRVLGFRNNGEVVMEIMEDNDFGKSQIEVYEPSSGCITSVGISGECHKFTAWSYMETLLLLDESNSIIH